VLDQSLTPSHTSALRIGFRTTIRSTPRSNFSPVARSTAKGLLLLVQRPIYSTVTRNYVECEASTALHIPSYPPQKRVTPSLDAGEWVWGLDHCGSQMSAQVCCTPYGWELRIILDGHFRYAQRHPTRTLALDDAASCLRQFETSGWIRPHTDAGEVEVIAPSSEKVVHARDVAQ
jgi:hypothetical protein